MTNREMLAEIRYRWEGRHDQHYPARYTTEDRDLARSRERAEIDWALRTLTPFEERAIQYRIGIPDNFTNKAQPPMSSEEIAPHFAVSVSRIRARLNRGLEKLCHPLRLGHFLNK